MSVFLPHLRFWRGLLPALAALLFLAFAPLPALAQRAAGAETRALKIYFVHTGEKEEVVFKKNGRYLRPGLKRLNYLLRDWRRHEATNMDPRLFDLVWQIYQLSGSHDYIHVVSAYRSPQTNAMLRLSSPQSGVARHSRHMEGKAMDFYLPDANLAYVRAIALKLQGGGIGYYPSSGSPFVHVDVGGVRHWPRMSRAALAALFPDGRSLHIPADGRPLAHYAEAAADYQARSATALPVFSARALFGALPPRQIVLAAADGHLPVGRAHDLAGFGHLPAWPAPAAAAPQIMLASLPASVPVPVFKAQEAAEAEADEEAEDLRMASIPVPLFKAAFGASASGAAGGATDPVITAVAEKSGGAALAYAPVRAAEKSGASAAFDALLSSVPVPSAKPQNSAESASKPQNAETALAAAPPVAPVPQPKPALLAPPQNGNAGKKADFVSALIAQNMAEPHSAPPSRAGK